MLRDVQAALRFARGLRGFAAQPLSLAACKEHIRRRLCGREKSFLLMVEGSVFANPTSPYRALFRHAGVEFPDIVQTVRKSGIETTLQKLREAGVYVSLDEFKGHRPIQRDGLELPARPDAFDNPVLNPGYEVSTGGSRGAGRRIVVDLDAVANDAAYHLIFLESFGLLGRPFALYRPAPPGSAGLKKALHQIKAGQPTAAWFSQTRNGLSTRRLRYWLFVELAVWLTRLSGRAIPAPRHTPLERVSDVARWLAAQKQAGRPGVLDSTASSATRVCLSAREAGLDISGSFFRVGGEPFTLSKARVMQEMGCRAVCHYSMAEVGHIGVACADPVALDDVHFLSDKMALVHSPENTAGAVGLLLTSLLAASPRVMINVEVGDRAVYKERDCGCPFGALGLRAHLHTVRSYEKLTTGGMNFLGYQLIELLEETLPKAFGGTPIDYQLVETEEDGVSKVYLCVDPRVGRIDESAMLSTVYRALEGSSPAHKLMADYWGDAQTLKIVRRQCYTTHSSKTHALHVLREPIDAKRPGERS